jgi:spermidine synthase
VLVLGLGAGSAARLVRALAPRARIVGGERSAEVLRAARRHFGLDALGVEVVHADARD